MKAPVLSEMPSFRHREASGMSCKLAAAVLCLGRIGKYNYPVGAVSRTSRKELLPWT